MLISHLILAQLQETDPELFFELKKECEQRYIEMLEKNLNSNNASADNVSEGNSNFSKEN